MPVNILVTLILCLMFLDGTLGCRKVFLLAGNGSLHHMHDPFRPGATVKKARSVRSHVTSKSIFGGGGSAVIFGGDLVVDNACIIAANFGVSQNFIGLTIIAIGTSRRITSLDCGKTRKETAAGALGNAVGSNLFNILFILGMSAAISPPMCRRISIDCVCCSPGSGISAAFARTNGLMSRAEGAVWCYYTSSTRYISFKITSQWELPQYEDRLCLIRNIMRMHLGCGMQMEYFVEKCEYFPANVCIDFSVPSSTFEHRSDKSEITGVF